MSKAHSMAKLAGSWTSEFPGVLLFMLRSTQQRANHMSFPQLNQEYKIPLAKGRTDCKR